MKTYILKKDLPTLKAGAIFKEDSEGIWACNPPQYHMRFGFPKAALNVFPDVLTDWFEEISEEPKTVWDLEGTMQCWVIGDDSTWPSRWCDIVGAVDKRNVGLIALTKDEADKEIARLKARQILLRDTKGFKPDWKIAGQLKYEVYYSYSTSELRSINYSDCSSHADLWFRDRGDAERSILHHAKEWKIYLGVEDE